MAKQGLYLVAPHGRLVFTGEKRVIATGRRFPVEGERVICSKEDGVGLAFGVAVIGDPSVVDAGSFDDRFSEHKVSKAARLKWWADKPHLYLYPVQYFTPFPEPVEIDISPGTIMDMGEIDLPFDGHHLVIPDMPDTIMSSKEETMPWKPSEAQEFTKKADTPEKQKLWADTANGRLKQCQDDGGETKECEASAVRVANAAVAREKAFEEERAAEALAKALLPTIKTCVVDTMTEVLGEKAGDDGEGETHVCTCPNCKADTESDVPCSETQCPECGSQARGGDDETKAVSEPDDKDEKAGRRLSSRVMEKLRSAMDTISELIGHGEYSDKKPEPDIVSQIVASVTPSKSFKSLGADPQGREWFMLWPTNAYKDREGEFFTTPSLTDFVSRSDAKSIRADFWHVPGSEFGTIQTQAVVADHFICQLGTYDDTPMGKAFKSFFDTHPDGHPDFAPHGWGTSHEFSYKHKDREDGIFTVFDIHKSTVLPLSKAANIYNPTPVMGGFKMNDEQKAAFDAIGAELGIEGLADQVIAMGQNAKQKLDEVGAERKSLKEEQVPDEEDESQDDSDEEKKPKTEEKKEVAVAEIAEAVGKEIGLDALSTTINDLIAANKALQEQLASLNSTVEEVKQDKEEDAEKLIGTPRFAWQAFQASKAVETRTSNQSPIRPGSVPNVVEQLAAKQLAQK